MYAQRVPLDAAQAGFGELRSISVSDLDTLQASLGNGGLAATPTAGILAPVNAAQVLSIPSRASRIAPGRFVVVYREAAAANSQQRAEPQAAGIVAHLSMAAARSAPGESDEAAFQRLTAAPGVEFVLRDRYVAAHRLFTEPPANDHPQQPFLPGPGLVTIGGAPGADAFYNSPQGWAVRQAGGYGANVAGGPAAGPWNAGMGAGVRLAVLDSGVDLSHPDIAPNLTLNLTEVDTTALPSACDDGSPQDQQGHGTWTASLAAGAIGSSTGGVIGVAPQASLLNIKVLERLPGAGVNIMAQCNAGEAGGLLSWVLQGIGDAVANKADVISLSLGALVDLNTGDGAGWKAAFDRATHAASVAGVVVVAALGNDGLDLSGTAANPSHYVELPAQARDVLPVVAATNPACAENLAPGAVCAAGPVSRAYYSNFGATVGAIGAPGGSYPESSETGVSGGVRGACTTGLASGAGFACFGSGRVAYMQGVGTSAAAPLAAGVAALVRAAHPAWTAAQLVSALRATAQVSGSMTEPQLDAAAALALP